MKDEEVQRSTAEEAFGNAPFPSLVLDVLALGLDIGVELGGITTGHHGQLAGGVIEEDVGKHAALHDIGLGLAIVAGALEQAQGLADEVPHEVDFAALGSSLPGELRLALDRGDERADGVLEGIGR